MLTIALLVLFASVPIVAAGLVLLPAPYGRYTTQGWGPTVSARAGWILMELPAPAVILFVAVLGKPLSLAGVILLGLWEFHYVYRTFVFPFLIRDSGKRFPVALISIAVVFNTINGYANGLSLSPPVGIGYALGVALFAVGFLTHVRADAQLRRLRARGETGYTVPRGGLFEKVTCPNYFGEIVEWCGWALAAWSLAGLAFALFTAANLVPRAHAHRDWYRRNFPEFPLERKRVVPFLF